MSNGRTTGDIRREIESERDQLAAAVEDLRSGISDATNVSAKLRAQLPAVTAGALAAGFVIAGGIGSTVRFFFRKGREGTEVGRVGRFRIVDRD